ncbi:MAG TPA: PQQ-binding-like beta-propeller repeat protein [Pirellulales bacterium]|jgi:outer membrane protein assembly factor BamB
MSAPTISHAPASGLKRRAVPMIAMGLAVVVIALIWALPPDMFDRGMRNSFTFLAGVGLLLVMGIWFFFLSGASFMAKLTGLAILVALAATWMAAVRRVEFFGDMIPTFDFRWRPSREALLDARLAEQQAAGPAPAAALDAERIAHPMPEDTPQYRGAHRDGVVIGPRLARDWEKQPPRLLWSQSCGGGYAGFAVVGDLAITIEQRRKNEVVVAYDVPTGRELWAYVYPALFHEAMGGDGPRATPAIAEGRVYSLGATGDLVCVDAISGQPLWSKNILEDNGSGNLDWGMSGSPLVTGGLVIVNPGTQPIKGSSTSDQKQKSAALVAYDAATGDIRWRGGEGKASYASPDLLTLDGAPTVVTFDAVGLAGNDPATGHDLWRFPWTSDFDTNAAQPLAVNASSVVLSSASGCALLALSKTGEAWEVTPKWRNRSMKCSYSNPVIYGSHLYGLDAGVLECVDLTSGERTWRKGRYGHGQILLSGDLILALTEKGELALVEANPQEFKELGIIQAIHGKTWNNPALVGALALVRNHLEMACYELPVEESAPGSGAAPPSAAP